MWGSVVLFWSQFDCGSEEAVEKSCFVSDDAVHSAVSQIVRTVFVFEQRVSSSVGLGESAMVQASFPEQANEIKPLLGFFSLWR